MPNPPWRGVSFPDASFMKQPTSRARHAEGRASRKYTAYLADLVGNEHVHVFSPQLLFFETI
jgi:hypothetical protein